MKKIFKIILAVVVSVVFCGAAVSLFRPAKKDDTPAVDKPVVNKPVVSATVNECAFVDQVVDDMGMKVTTDNTRAGKPWLLSTEITREGVATDSALTWSSSWGSTTGSWGTETQGEVSDYVEITPLENGQAEVEFLKPFGTTIDVKAAVDGNTYSTVVFGYLDAEKVNFAITYGDSNPEYFFLYEGENKVDFINDAFHDRTQAKFYCFIDDIYSMNVAYINSKILLRYTEENIALYEEAGADLDKYDNLISATQYPEWMYLPIDGSINIFDFLMYPFVYHDADGVGDTVDQEKAMDYMQLLVDNPDVPMLELRFELGNTVKEYTITYDTNTIKLMLNGTLGA